MATKRKTASPVVREPSAAPEPVVVVAPPAPKVCGHVNRHSVGLDKKLDYMLCDKPPGHSGDHEGDHLEWEKHEETSIVHGEEEIRVFYAEVVLRRQWNDAAGVEVKNIPPPVAAPQLSLADLERRVSDIERRRQGASGGA